MESACVRWYKSALEVNRGTRLGQPARCNSSNGVLLRDIPSLRLHYQLEFVRLQERIVAEFEREVGRLLKLLRQVALFLQHVHHDVGVQLHQQVVASSLDSHSLHRALHASDDRLGSKHSSGSVASRTRLGRGLVVTLADALAGHLDQTKVAHRKRLRSRAITG